MFKYYSNVLYYMFMMQNILAFIIVHGYMINMCGHSPLFCEI